VTVDGIPRGVDFSDLMHELPVLGSRIRERALARIERA
jgi:hypothetical protein